MIDQNHTSTQRRNLSRGQQPNKPQNFCIVLWDSQTMLCKDLQLRKMNHKIRSIRPPPPPPRAVHLFQIGGGGGGRLLQIHAKYSEWSQLPLLCTESMHLQSCLRGYSARKNLLHVIHANSPNLAGSLPIFG